MKIPRVQKTLLVSQEAWDVYGDIAKKLGLLVKSGESKGKPATGRVLDLLARYPDVLLALARKAMEEVEDVPQDTDKAE